MRSAVLMIALLLVPASSGAQNQSVIYRESRRLMWTQFEIVAYGSDRARLAEAAEAAFEEIDRLDRQMSNYSEASELTYINRNAARADVIVEKELFDLLKLSFDHSRSTGGAFDITVGPLMKAWGFFKGAGRLPEPKELSEVMAKIGYERVSLDERRRAVRFKSEGMEIDLGGIAKGYAVDRAAQILRESGVTSALITAGTSSIYAIGSPPGQAGWRIEVRDPTDPSRIASGIEIKDRGVSTSGCYEKTFRAGGKTYCHIMDPRTGYPVERMLGATVLTPRAVDAEALSKAAMVRGIQWTGDYAKRRTDIGVLLFYRQPEGGVGVARFNL